MRNLRLVDAVVQLHDIARLVETEVGEGELSLSIRGVADRLHEYSIQDNKASIITQSIINQVKE
jgi:hypothetical protein